MEEEKVLSELKPDKKAVLSQETPATQHVNYPIPILYLEFRDYPL